MRRGVGQLPEGEQPANQRGLDRSRGDEPRPARRERPPRRQPCGERRQQQQRRRQRRALHIQPQPRHTSDDSAVECDQKCLISG